MKRKITSLTTAIIVLCVMLIGLPETLRADDTYVKVTNSNQVSSGSQIIFVCEDNNQAMTSSSNYPGTSITISNSTITLTSTSTVCVLTVGGSAGAYTFTYGTNTQLSWAKNGFSTNQTSDNKNLWTIASDGSFTNNVSNSVTDASTRKQVRHNTNNTNKFGCYTSSTGAAVCLYVKQTTPAYTITAESNNTNYGTVSLNGSVITGSPKSGYRYASPAYTVYPANSATVNQDGNLFTVTPSANTTVTINFEAIPSHTATFSINGATSTQDFLEGATITFPSDPEDIGGKTFRGWITNTIDGTTNVAPSFVNTSTTTMDNSDVTYYAVFATATPGSPVETKTQELAYDSWSYSGSTTDKDTYRLFHTNSYIESVAFDLSKLSKVVVYGGTFGGSDYNSLTIGDGTNTWKSVTVSGSSQTGTNTYTDGNDLTGTKKLRITSNSGTASSTGVRISEVDIYTMETSYTYSAYCTTVVIYSVATPQFYPSKETFSTAPLLITLSCNTDGATIHYTTNGDEPTSESAAYSTAISINATTTIKAKAFKDANESETASKTYTKVYSVTLSSNGIADDPIEVIPGESTTLTAPTNIPFGYTFRGWTATPAEPDDMVDNTYTPSANVTLYAVFGQNNYGDFIKVTSEPNNWSGYYLIVYIDNNSSIALNGSLGSDKIDDTNNGVSVSIDEDNGIYSIAKASGESYKLMFSSVTNGYSIKSPAGYYIGHTGSNNTLNTNTNESATGFTNTISIDNNSVATIKVGDTYQIKFNNDNNQKRFRYYTSGANVYLFKQEVLSYTGYYTKIYPSNATATGNIDVSTSGPMLIESGATLNMNDYTLTCKDPANLIIEDGGQLICDNSVAATFKKTMPTPAAPSTKDEPEDVYGWELISSPVHDDNGSTIEVTNVTNLTTSTYDMFAYDEENSKWINQKATLEPLTFAFDKMYAGQGYMYRNNAQELSFVGNTNVNDVEVSLTYTAGAGDLAGFHLVGNPYAENITLMNTTLYNEDIQLDNDKQLSAYYILENNGSSWKTDLAANTPIANKQGFLIEIPLNATKIKFSRTARGSAKYHSDNIKFMVANSQFEDVAYALFDKALPLNKINHRNPEVPMIYINQNDQDYAVATMTDDTKVFNLNFKAATAGKYTLSYKATGDYNYLHVIDRLTGEDIDMLLEGEYTFIGTPKDSENRFIVHLEYIPNYGEDGNDIFAYQSGSDIYVSGQGELQIFDVTGRRVMTTTINGAESINLSAKGVYIFKLNEKVQKIVVR